MLARNRIVARFGLEVSAESEILSPEIKASYAVGDRIGPWPIFALTDSELIAGRDNSHLDFRLSVLRTSDRGVPHITVSTVCSVHNLAGKLYLFVIIPLHKWGVRRLMTNAVAAGRL